MTEKISYENPDGTYDAGAGAYSIATALAHLRQYYAEHPEVVSLPEDDSTSAEQDLPHAS